MPTLNEIAGSPVVIADIIISSADPPGGRYRTVLCCTCKIYDNLRKDIIYLVAPRPFLRLVELFLFRFFCGVGGVGAGA